MTSAIDRVLCLVAVPFLFVSLAQDASAQETAKGLLAAQARPGIPLRQADQRQEECKTIASRRGLLGSPVRTQFLHDAADP